MVCLLPPPAIPSLGLIGIAGADLAPGAAVPQPQAEGAEIHQDIVYIHAISKMKKEGQRFCESHRQAFHVKDESFWERS